MHPLLLSGFDMKLRVCRQSRAEIEVVDGHDGLKMSTSTRYKPREFPFSSVICDGRSGYFSIGALRRLAKEQIPIFLTEPDGTLLYSILPPSPIKPNIRIAQLDASRDPEKSFHIARAIIKGKLARTLQVLTWLSERYDVQKQLRLVKREAMRLPDSSTVSQLRTCEGRVALGYWSAFGKCLPPILEFKTRMSSTRQQRSDFANDPVNICLNWGYGFLQSEIRRIVNSIGLECGVGFLHTTADYQSKQSMVFDVMEPYRFLVDLTVIQMVESKILDWRSVFFQASDYRARLDNGAKQKFIRLLRERFNVGTVYKNQRMRWDTVIAEKFNEVTRFLLGKTNRLDFMEPSLTLERFDSRELRSKILSLNASEARGVGIPKQSLHDLRAKAGSPQPFKLHNETMRKLLTV